MNIFETWWGSILFSAGFLTLLLLPGLIEDLKNRKDKDKLTEKMKEDWLEKRKES